MSRKSQYSRALLEGVVIVGSILLAFGVDAWWDGLQERASERDYLSRIATDLAEMRKDIVDRSDHYAMIADHGRAVVPILAGEQPIPFDTLGFLASALNATRMIEPVVARSAYDDSAIMKSTASRTSWSDRSMRPPLGSIGVMASPEAYHVAGQDHEPLRGRTGSRACSRQRCDRRLEGQSARHEGRVLIEARERRGEQDRGRTDGRLGESLRATARRSGRVR